MPEPPVSVDVIFEERYWYPEDGGAVWLSGYNVVDPDTGEFLARDAPSCSLAGCGWSASPASRTRTRARSSRMRPRPGSRWRCDAIGTTPTIRAP